MNRTFKIVFNRVRGKMMVVNEATSSTQRGGRSTAVKIAAAAIFTVSLLAHNGVIANTLSVNDFTNGELTTQAEDDTLDLQSQEISYKTFNNINPVIKGNDGATGGKLTIENGTWRDGGRIQSEQVVLQNVTFDFSETPNSYLLFGTSNPNNTLNAGAIGIIGTDSVTIGKNVNLLASSYFDIRNTTLTLRGGVLSTAQDTRSHVNREYGHFWVEDATLKLWDGEVRVGTSGYGEFYLTRGEVFVGDESLQPSLEQSGYKVWISDRAKTEEDQLTTFFTAKDLGRIIQQQASSFEVYGDATFESVGSSYLLDNSFNNDSNAVGLVALGNSEYVFHGKFTATDTDSYLDASSITIDGATKWTGNSKIQLVSNASINVNNSLTMGGEGFSVGSEDAYAVGRIISESSVTLSGGEYYYSSKNSAQDVGMLARTELNINSGAQLYVMDGAHVFTGYGYNDGKDTSSSYPLTLSGEDTVIHVGGRGNNGSVPNFYKLTATSYVTGGDEDPRNWAIFGSSGTLKINNGASVFIESAGILTSHWHQLLTDSSMSLHMNGAGNDPAALIANGSASILGLTSTYNGRVWIESLTGGGLSVAGGHWDIQLSGPRTVGIAAQAGNVKLISIKDEQEESLDGLMKIQGGKIHAGQSLRIFGDDQVSITGTSLTIAGAQNQLVEIVSPGNIGLSGVTVDTRSEDEVNQKISIFTGSTTSHDVTKATFTPETTSGLISITGNGTNRSAFYANHIEVGSEKADALGISVENSTFTTAGNDKNSDAYGIGFYAGSEGIQMTGTEVAYSGQDAGVTNLITHGGAITLTDTTINDNLDTDGTDAQGTNGKGVLTVEIKPLDEESVKEALISLVNSTLDDDTINLGNGSETIKLSETIIHPDSDGDGVTIKAKEFAMAEGSHIGVTSDGTSAGTLEETGAVSITAPTVSLDGSSYITSSGNVSLSAPENGNLTLSMDQESSGNSWIKGGSVSISGAGVGVTGGSISTIGNTGNDINITGGNQGISLDGTGLDAGKGTVNIGSTKDDANSDIKIVFDENDNAVISGGQVNIGYEATGTATGSGVISIENANIASTDEENGAVNIASGTQTNATITDSNISAPTVNMGVGTGGVLTVTGSEISAGKVDFAGKGDTTDNPGKVIFGDGSSIEAGSEGNAGQVTVGSGINVVINNGAALNANGSADDDQPGIDVDGGKLTIDQGGQVSTNDNVNVDNGGSIEFTGSQNSGSANNPGKLVAGGAIAVGGSDGSGSITVADGADGVIVAQKPQTGSGNASISVGSDGLIGVGSGSHLFVTNDESDIPTGVGSGLVINEGTDVGIDGGTVSADRIINVDENNKVTVTDNDSYVDLENPFDDEGNLSFDIDEGNGQGLTIEVGDLSEEQYKKFQELLKDYEGKTNITAVVGVGDGDEKTLEEWDAELGTGVVAAGGGVNVSKDGTSGRPADTIGHGGGSYLVGSGNGPITVTGSNKGETSKVTITGSQVQEGADSFEIVRPAGAGEAGLELEDGTHLTLGNSSSWGGHLSGSITAEKGDDVTVEAIGGHWDIDGEINLGNGDLIIHDRFDADGSKDAVVSADSANVGHLEMKGDTTGLTTKGDLTVNNGAYISGGSATDNSGAHVQVGGDFDITKGGLTMAGNANVNVAGASEIKGGMLVESDSSFTTGKDLTVTGGDSQFDGTVTVGQNYKNTDGNTIVNGTTQITGTAEIGKDLIVGSADATDAPNGSFSAGDTTVSGSFTGHNQSQTTVAGDFNVSGQGSIGSGASLTVEGEAQFGDDLIVGGEDFDGNGVNGSYVAGNTTVGGNFIGHDHSQTTVNGDLTVAGESSIGAGASVAVNGNATMTGGLHVEENGSFVNNAADGKTEVNGFLIMDEGSKLQAGNSFSVGTGTSIGTNGDGVLNGLISAADTIDFSQVANSEAGITFTGEGAGTNAHHINMGSGSITYENGASHVFTKDADDKEGGIVTGTVNIGLGGSVTMDPDMMGSSDKAYLYMNDKLQLSDDSRVIVGDVGDQNTKEPGIYLGNGSSFGLNAGDFTSGDSILSGEGSFFVGDGAEISISDWGLGTDGTLKLDINLFDSVGSDVDIDSYISNLITSDNVLQDFWYSKDQQALGMDLLSSSTVGTDDMISDVVDAVISSDTENNRKQELIEEVFSKNSGFMTQDADGNWVVSGYGNQRLQDVLTLPIAAGSFNIAYDAMSEMNQSMANRMAESADELFGNSGYSADIYAGVLGADVGISNDWVAGIAFTIGQGDVEGDTMGIKNDADFYGVSLYTVKDLGQLRASADMGYLKVKNDISTNVNYGGKGDTDVLTVGGRLDMTVYQGESFDVTPHFGMRYANFSIDTMNGTATDDINVIEAPIGVTVKGKTTVDGWKVAPAVDVSVVPQFGDKKAKIWNSGVSYTQDVLDPALVRTSVGVTAQKDNFTFGLNYRLGVGANERQNHHFNATVRYQF